MCAYTVDDEGDGSIPPSLHPTTYGDGIQESVYSPYLPQLHPVRLLCHQHMWCVYRSDRGISAKNNGCKAPKLVRALPTVLQKTSSTIRQLRRPYIDYST